MSNSRYYQFLFSKVAGLTMIEGEVLFGATSAITSVSGVGFKGATKLAVGLFNLQMTDNFNHFVGFDWCMLSGVTGGSVNDGSLTVGTPYQIVTVGTTTWATVGLPAGLTAAIGMPFVASASDGSGNGTAKAITTTAVAGVEVCQNAQTETATSVSGSGAILIVQTLDYAGALVSPTSGSKLRFNAYFRNSSVGY